jgi:hypothetical protein
MNFEHHWNTHVVAMNEYGFLNEPGLLYTDGLGPCIGICLAYKKWAGIIHSSHPPHDEKEIGELIAEAKRIIPEKRMPLVRPILCGSDPDGSGEDDPKAYEQERLDARQKAIDILKAAGFGEPHLHWSAATETAAVFADLAALKVIVEVQYDYFEHPILQE